MEINLKIPAQDGKMIYARLCGPIDRILVIFVHGLGGRMDQHIFYNYARFLEKHGISSIRFNLYSWEDDARKLDECTLKTHSEDLDTVIAYGRGKGANKIIVIGHSYGGPTILFSKDKNFNAVILWDPSYGYPDSFKRSEYIESLRLYKATWEFNVLIGKQMIDEAKDIEIREEQAIKELKVPVKVISAGQSHLVKGCKRYFELANEPKEYTLIENAGHTFDEEGTEEKLFEETLTWINAHCS